MANRGIILTGNEVIRDETMNPSNIIVDDSFNVNGVIDRKTLYSYTLAHGTNGVFDPFDMRCGTDISKIDNPNIRSIITQTMRDFFNKKGQKISSTPAVRSILYRLYETCFKIAIEEQIYQGVLTREDTINMGEMLTREDTLNMGERLTLENVIKRFEEIMRRELDESSTLVPIDQFLKDSLVSLPFSDMNTSVIYWDPFYHPDIDHPDIVIQDPVAVLAVAKTYRKSPLHIIFGEESGRYPEKIQKLVFTAYVNKYGSPPASWSPETEMEVHQQYLRFCRLYHILFIEYTFDTFDDNKSFIDLMNETEYLLLFKNKIATILPNDTEVTRFLKKFERTGEVEQLKELVKYALRKYKIGFIPFSGENGDINNVNYAYQSGISLLPYLDVMSSLKIPEFKIFFESVQGENLVEKFKTKYEYRKSFLSVDTETPPCWVDVNIDGTFDTLCYLTPNEACDTLSLQNDLKLQLFCYSRLEEKIHTTNLVKSKSLFQAMHYNRNNTFKSMLMDDILSEFYINKKIKISDELLLGWLLGYQKMFITLYACVNLESIDGNCINERFKAAPHYEKYLRVIGGKKTKKRRHNKKNVPKHYSVKRLRCKKTKKRKYCLK